MRTIIILLLLPVLLLMSHARGAWPEPVPPQPLLLTITSDRQVYEEGDRITITLTIKNVSAGKIAVFTRYLKGPHYLLGRGDGVCDIINSKDVRIHCGLKMEPTAAAIDEFLVLAPGEARTYSFNLNKFLEMAYKKLTPDKYRITYYYHGMAIPGVQYPWTGKITSNTIPIEVVKKGY